MIAVEVDPAAIAAAMFDLLETLMAGHAPAESHVRIAPKLRDEPVTSATKREPEC